jgi:hypothetical protein
MKKRSEERTTKRVTVVRVGEKEGGCSGQKGTENRGKKYNSENTEEKVI